jgi:hypothetical protein
MSRVISCDERKNFSGVRRFRATAEVLPTPDGLSERAERETCYSIASAAALGLVYDMRSGQTTLLDGSLGAKGSNGRVVLSAAMSGIHSRPARGAGKRASPSPAEDSPGVEKPGGFPAADDRRTVRINIETSLHGPNPRFPTSAIFSTVKPSIPTPDATSEWPAAASPRRWPVSVRAAPPCDDTTRSADASCLAR